MNTNKPINLGTYGHMIHIISNPKVFSTQEWNHISLVTDSENNTFCMTYAGHLGTSMKPIYLQSSVQTLVN